MSNTYGIEAAGPPSSPSGESAPAARWLVLIETGQGRVARLYLESRDLVAEFNAGAQEVEAMVRDLLPQRGATEPAWDTALTGHSDEQRREAEVYTLDI